MKVHFALFSLIFALFFLFTSVSVFGAVPPSSPLGYAEPSSVGENPVNITDIILSVVYWIAWIIAVLAVIFGLYSAVLFIISSGDENQIKKAKHILIFVVVGIIVALLSFGIVALVRSVLDL